MRRTHQCKGDESEYLMDQVERDIWEPGQAIEEFTEKFKYFIWGSQAKLPIYKARNF